MCIRDSANSVHVDLALKHDIDILWIGARSTVSPFIVQEIANALKGTDKIVLIKNPVNPDLSLWLGGIERIYTSDIKKIGAIHRGFSTYDKSNYRNNPEWQIAVELQSNFPDLPLICDPSHIAGNRDLSFDLINNFCGGMLDGHHLKAYLQGGASGGILPAAINFLAAAAFISGKSMIPPHGRNMR